MKPNVICIVIDTLRQDACGCYGNKLGATPNLDALARESAKFAHCLPASFPTGPMRKDLHFGKFTFLRQMWRTSVAKNDVPIGKVLARAGYRVGMVSDVGNSQFPYGIDDYNLVDVHTFKPNEDDSWKKIKLPAKVRKLRAPKSRLQILLARAAAWEAEEEHCAARVFRQAHQWLERNAFGKKPFCLMVDSFDPHEPWDAPRYYVEKFSPNYKGEELFEPAYARNTYASREEVKHMRAMYAAKVNMVDTWLGFLLDGVRRMGLWDDTAILLTSDHGFYHGEHGLIGKMELCHEDSRPSRRWALYDTIMRVPLLIKVPGVKPRTTEALCQPPDLTATMAEIGGAKPPAIWQGESLLRVIRGKVKTHRSCTLSSFGYVQDPEVRTPTCYRTDKYLYVYGGDEWPHELFDLEQNPGQTRNIINQNLDVARRLHRQYLGALEKLGCPKSSLKLREEFMPKARDVSGVRSEI